MRFLPTPMAGLFVVELEPVEDGRGFFARTWDAAELAARGLNPNLAQCSLSLNRRRGTVRGLHWQAAPHEEAKLVRCTRGAIFDVAVDVRPGSPTRHRWHALELTADNRRALYIPEGFAHGFQALEDGSEVQYQISVPYAPDAARGLRWDDPALGIDWPLPDAFVSGRDRSFPLLDSAAC